MSQSTIILIVTGSLRQPLLTASANRAKVVQPISSIITLNETNSSTDNNLPIHHATTTEQLISSDKEDKINTVDQLTPAVAPQIVINEPVGIALNADAVNQPSTTIIKGSTRTQLKASRHGLNLLEWLHLRLGHADPELIKWMVRHQVVRGLYVTYDQVKNLSMRMCYACLISKMKALPIYQTLSDKSYYPFYKLSSDWIPFNCEERDGYTGFFLYVDYETTKIWIYLALSESDWLESLIFVNNSERQRGARPLRIIQTDNSKVPISADFTLYIKESGIEYHSSAPYRHEQNYAERNVQTVKNGIRASLTYNKAPVEWYGYAAKHFEATYNCLCKRNTKVSRNDAFYGSHQEADVGTFVPFFAKGVAYLHPHERYNYDAKTKALHDRSREVRCVGYAFNGHKLNQAENPVTYVKDSYIIYLPDQDAIRVRHDCYFQSYTDQDGKDFQIGGVVETPQDVNSINQDISNDKELFESYDKAFGIWKTHEWTGIDQKLIENKSLPDQPLYSLAPTIINSSDHSTTNDEDIPLPISIAIDDYGYVKPSRNPPSFHNNNTRITRSKTFNNNPNPDNFVPYSKLSKNSIDDLYQDEGNVNYWSEDMLETAKIASSLSSNHFNIEQDANIRFTARSFRRKQINSYISPSNSTNPDYILIP